MLTLLLMFSLPGFAAGYAASIEQSKWELVASKFSCRLSQQIPLFGDGEFNQEAGETVRFTLKPLQGHGLKGQVQLMEGASPWQPGIAPREIGEVTFTSNGTIAVPTGYSQQMLASLFRGRMPTFLAQNWADTGESVRIALSAANFPPAYAAYADCIADLLPVNYRQIARTAVLFPSAQWKLSDSTKARLDLIAIYVNNDDSVKTVFVDGHSDAQGRRLANRDLSKKRAEAVTSYLEKKGVSPDRITTRYHGERYPVAQKNDRQTRDRSRRVTIRLDRN
ncbi:OmpA family protein [Amphritea sp. 1_MG-2023]|uniref:flagellar protein MotY n=1 Tax=Amphritea sp. 1_MG-2023 TaxID=3062670 RepID=UPI0026E24501|nr:OmpA family protein [Amphritea sp. 1_MG-2023]MDO6564122.1 OmpA family protein [Amphritea sp. 1_MG-2023]